MLEVAQWRGKRIAIQCHVKEKVFQLNGTQVLINLVGGILLLLWGIRSVRTGIMRGYGSEIRGLMSSLSVNRLSACFSGIMLGAVLQSTTATALLACSFVGASQLSLAAGLALMLGADFGATFAAKLFSTGISAYWPLTFLLGYLLFVLGSEQQVRIRYTGRALMGLGLVLLALTQIGEGVESVGRSETIRDLILATSAEPVIALLTGALVTWLIHSSLATILLVAALAGSGIASAESFLPFVLGVNLGAALPALSATIGQSIEARRLPVGNFIYRTLAVFTTLPFLSLVMPWLSRLTVVPAEQIIYAHMIFNAGLCVVFIFTVKLMSALLKKVLPAVRPEPEDTWAPRALDSALHETPSVALGMAARESLRMGDLVESMMSDTLTALRNNDLQLRSTIIDNDDRVDLLHESIKLFLTQLSRAELEQSESIRAIDIITFTTNLEHVGDIIDKNLMDLVEKKARDNLEFSDEGWQELSDMHTRIMDTLRLSLSVFLSQDFDDARELVARKDQFRSLELKSVELHLERMRSGEINSIQTSALHLDLLRDFKRINSHLTSAAYPILDRAGALYKSRLMKPAH